MARIFGIGEIVFDIIFKDGEPRSGVPGGSTFNAMVSLGRTAGKLEQPVPVTMISQLGADSVGNQVIEFMRCNGLDTTMMKRIPDVRTTLSIAMLDERGDASYEFYRDPSMPPFKADELEFMRGDYLIFGSFFAIDPSTREETVRLVKKAREAGAVIYYDVNFRKGHMAGRETLMSAINENMMLSDFVRASSEDIHNLYGSDDATQAYSEHILPYCSNFICTKGAEPVETFSNGMRKCLMNVRKIKPISTIGAGDNFNAGFVYSLMRENISKNLDGTLPEFEWERLIPTALNFSENVCQSLWNYVDEGFDPEA